MRDPFRSTLEYWARSYSEHHRYLHAAVIAKGKSILGWGVNTQGEHAEEAALRRGGFSRGWHLGLRGATLYTVMIKVKSGEIGNGAPCSKCMKALAKAGVRKVVVYL